MNSDWGEGVATADGGGGRRWRRGKQVHELQCHWPVLRWAEGVVVQSKKLVLQTLKRGVVTLSLLAPNALMYPSS